MGNWTEVALESNRCISRYELNGSLLRGTVFYDEMTSSVEQCMMDYVVCCIPVMADIFSV